MRRILLGVVFAAGLSGTALAATLQFNAVLSPASEVPPVHDVGAGQATATLDTVSHKLTYTLTFSGFTSKVTMAHFHGPAGPGENAGVQVPLGTDPSSPLTGTVTITPPQQAQLISGHWYANVHTTAHPKGAARGQLLEVP